LASLPSNCRFIIDDIEHEWVFSDQFDLVIARAMLGTWNLEGWEDIINKAYELSLPYPCVQLLFIYLLLLLLTARVHEQQRPRAGRLL
jgi:hypothetical protein